MAGEGGDPRNWINGDESAKEMLARVLSERPFLVPFPPLHRVPLRLGNVLEISGQSSSAKSQTLLQAIIYCILPKEWGGIHFGGMECSVIYFDLDCRFDVLRLSQILSHRLAEAQDKNGIFCECMNRFLYVRCYTSSEFLDALKALQYQIQRRSVGKIRFLMIDSIGAFHWIDRACQNSKGQNFSIQSLMQEIVHELNELLLLQPLLILATKSTLYRVKTSNDFQSHRNSTFREYMPSVWQSFVTHRIQLHVSEGFSADMAGENIPVYTSEWMQPPLNMKDNFSVRDDGIVLVP